MAVAIRTSPKNPDRFPQGALEVNIYCLLQDVFCLAPVAGRAGQSKINLIDGEVGTEVHQGSSAFRSYDGHAGRTWEGSIATDMSAIHWSVPSNSGFSTQWTMACWVDTHTFNSFAGFCGAGKSAEEYGFQCGWEGAATDIRSNVFDGVTEKVAKWTGYSYNQRWIHVASRWEGTSGTYDFWVDGVQRASNSAGGLGSDAFTVCAAYHFWDINGLSGQQAVYDVLFADRFLDDVELEYLFDPRSRWNHYRSWKPKLITYPTAAAVGSNTGRLINGGLVNSGLVSGGLL